MTHLLNNLSPDELDGLEAATVEHRIWTKDISGSRGGISYAGTLTLFQGRDGAGRPTFRMEAAVKRPAEITVSRPIRGNLEEHFTVSIVPCWHKVSNWHLTETYVSFSYDAQAFYFGWFSLFDGPIVARLVPRAALETAYREAAAFTGALEKAGALPKATADSVSPA